MNPSRLAAAVVVLACLAGAAHARGQLQTRQTGIDLPAGARAGRLVLANSGDAPVAAQVRVYAWSQDGTDDQLVPSDQLLATPVIVEIPAGGEQLVRVVRATAATPARERAYRVVVDELPGDPRAGAGVAVTVRMRYLIPVFERATDPAPASLRCRVHSARLACENRGGRAAQLGASTIVDAAGHKIVITPGLLGYVLAGSARSWALDPPALAGLGPRRTLRVRLNGEPATVELDPAP